MEFSKRLDLFKSEIFASIDRKKQKLEKQGKKVFNFQSARLTL